jgi:uncharacterized membrane protein HdeD (DUF308 family)
MDAKISCLIKGLIGVVFGSLALVFPDPLLATFLALFLVLVGAGLVICVFLAITSQKEESFFWFIIGTGFLIVGIGSLIFAWLVAILFLIAVAALAFYSGYAGISLALSRPKVKYILIGGAFVIGIILLTLLITYIPAMSTHLILTVLGVFALVFGLFSIFMGWSIKEGEEVPQAPLFIPSKICYLPKSKEKKE